VKSEEEAKQLVPERFYKWIHILARKSVKGCLQKRREKGSA